MRIYTEGNTILFQDGIGSDFLPISAAIHSLVHKLGHSEINLDFSEATFIDPRIMVPIVTIARGYRIEQVNFEIIPPKIGDLRKLIFNCNWAHLITPERFESQDNKSYRNLSAIQYKDGAEQWSAVNRCLETILRNTPRLTRRALRALE